MCNRVTGSSDQVALPTHYFLIASYCSSAGRSAADCDDSTVVMSLILPHKPAVTSQCWESLTTMVSNVLQTASAQAVLPLCRFCRNRLLDDIPSAYQVVAIIISGGACFPPRWCELLVGRPQRDVRVDHFSYPTRTRSR